MPSLLLLWKPAGAVALLLIFWTWETLRPFFASPPDRMRHALRNLLLTLTNTLILVLIFGTATVVIAELATEQRWGLLHLVELPWWVSLPVALLTQDLWLYVWHRANHAFPFLWRFHRMHHSDPSMDVTTATRFHLGELTMAALLRLGLLPLLGWELWHLIIYDTLVLAVTMFHHANISLGRGDGWLRTLIVTPFMHKTHHSHLPEELNSNYGTVLSLWDRLARTHRTRQDVAAIRFGVAGFEPSHWQTFLGLWRTPLASAKPQEVCPTRQAEEPSCPTEPAPSTATRN